MIEVATSRKRDYTMIVIQKSHQNIQTDHAQTEDLQSMPSKAFHRTTWLQDKEQEISK